jgi:hypothetical protein
MLEGGWRSQLTQIRTFTLNAPERKGCTGAQVSVLQHLAKVDARSSSILI